MKHHIIYIPGIDDDIGNVQSRLVSLWRFQGVRPTTFVIPWAGENNYDARKLELTQLIKQMSNGGNKVSLVGASAGGCAVLNEYLTDPDKLSGVAMICPKLINADNIGEKIVIRNPSFKQAMVELQVKLKDFPESAKSNLINFISPSDGIVSYQDSSIPGVKEISLPALKHSFAIVYALTFGSRRLIRELKRIAASA